MRKKIDGLRQKNTTQERKKKKDKWGKITETGIIFELSS
jgi:hypothetical protein